MNKLFIISDKNNKSKRISNFLKKKLKNNPFKNSNLVIVIGGDGFMLQTLKKKLILKIYFMELILAIMVF